jgi:DtxR family Mn-dependent transcriptional regulator
MSHAVTIVTEPTENILTAIYRLTREAPYARTKDIATSLGVSMPTVSEKIVKLADQGYLDHQWRKGVALTREGRILALSVLRKHRLIETFLVEVLKFSIEEVDEEACKLEHVVSDRFVDAIDAMLGHPNEDPHGHPIPTKEGDVPFAEYQSLADALPGWTAVVKQVSDRDRNHLCYLKGFGLVPGAMLSVLRAAPFDGPLSLNVEGRAVVVGRSIARKVSISVVDQGVSANGDD